MARPKGDHKKRRAKMAEATVRVVARRGLNNTSLRDIAAELGCTTGLLQHYFPNKSALLRFAKDTLFDQARKQMGNAAKGKVGIDRLRAMVLVDLPLDASRILMWRIYAAFVGGAVGNPEMMRIQRRQDMKEVRILRDEIRFLQREGYVSRNLDPTAEAHALTCLIDGIGVNAAISPKAMSRKLQVRIIESYINRTFAAPQPEVATRTER